MTTHADSSQQVPEGYHLSSDADYEAVEAGDLDAESWAFQAPGSDEWNGAYPTRDAALAAARAHHDNA